MVKNENSENTFELGRNVPHSDIFIPKKCRICFHKPSFVEVTKIYIHNTWYFILYQCIGKIYRTELIRMTLTIQDFVHWQLRTFVNKPNHLEENSQTDAGIYGCTGVHTLPDQIKLGLKNLTWKDGKNVRNLEMKAYFLRFIHKHKITIDGLKLSNSCNFLTPKETLINETKKKVQTKTF